MNNTQDTTNKSFGTVIIKILTKPLAILPLSFHRSMGRFLGWLIGSVFHYRRDVVMTNLSRSFPEKKYKELTQICKRFYTHFGTLIAETFWFGACTSPQGVEQDGINYRGNKRLRKANLVDIPNIEVLNELHAKGKSIMALASHCGNWEIYGGMKAYTPMDQGVAFNENDICIIYRKLASPAWDGFMSQNRIAPIVDKAHYDGLVESFSAMRYVFLNNNRPRFFQFIMDQYPYKGAATISVGNFLSQPTNSMIGATALAEKMGLAIVYIGMKEREEGGYTIEFTKICDDASEMTQEEILSQYYKLLEADIKEQPWNYLWTHKRWK